MLELDSLLGLTEKKALAKIKKAGFRGFVARRDKERFPYIMNYQSNRVNLEIDNGKITKATIG